MTTIIVDVVGRKRILEFYYFPTFPSAGQVIERQASALL